MAVKKKAARRPRRSKLDVEVIDVLRDKNRELTKELASVNNQLIAEERAAVILQRRAVAAEREAVVLMDALRALATGAPNTTWAGREARKNARKVLEAACVRPPSTLGHSREKGKKKSS